MRSINPAALTPSLSHQTACWQIKSTKVYFWYCCLLSFHNHAPVSSLYPYSIKFFHVASTDMVFPRNITPILGKGLMYCGFLGYDTSCNLIGGYWYFRWMFVTIYEIGTHWTTSHIFVVVLLTTNSYYLLHSCYLCERSLCPFDCYSTLVMDTGRDANCFSRHITTSVKSHTTHHWARVDTTNS